MLLDRKGTDFGTSLELLANRELSLIRYAQCSAAGSKSNLEEARFVSPYLSAFLLRLADVSLVL